MFNTEIKMGSHTVNFNSPCVGMLQKSHPKSTFVSCQQTSNMHKNLLPFTAEQPTLLKHKDSSNRVDVTVLQVMVFGEYILAEVVKNSDLEGKEEGE